MRNVPSGVERRRNGCLRRLHSTLAGATGTAFWLVDNWPLGLRGIYITSGYTFFSSIENFSASQPSLARFYSAAASPSERLRSDGSLAIIWKKSVMICPWSGKINWLSHGNLRGRLMAWRVRVPHDYQVHFNSRQNLGKLSKYRFFNKRSWIFSEFSNKMLRFKTGGINWFPEEPADLRD